MNLPHGKALRFANEIIDSSKDKISVSCSFPFIPTLSMACEAAAQATAAFAKEDEKVKMGFLISLKDVTLKEEMNFLQAIIILEKSFEFASMSEYLFILKNNNKVYVEGKITIALE